MAVRFLPPPGEPERELGEDRADLAEVIELRGLLQQRAWGDPVTGGDKPASAPGAHTHAPTDAEAAGSASSVDGSQGAGGSAEGPGSSGASDDRGDSAVRHGPGLAVVSALGDRLIRGSDIPTVRSGLGEVSAQPARSGELSASSGPRFGASEGTPHAQKRVGSAPESEVATERTATEDGVRLLARRARSSGELREELLRLEHAPGEVDLVIEEFRDSHYLDDLGLARTVTEKLRSSKGSSRSQIRVKLRDRRLPDAVIEEALGELDEDEELTLLRDAAVSRAAKLGGLERQVAERRLLGFLARRGWSGERATRIAKEALDGTARGGGGGGVRFR